MTPWMRKHFKVPAGSAEEQALSDWQHEIQFAIEQHDPSKLAYRLVTQHRNIPPVLRDYLYGLIVAAPWRDARPGVARKLNAVDEVGVVSLYKLIRSLSDRRQTRAMIVDQVIHQYGISKSTVERVLKAHGVAAASKPPRVLKPKTRR